MNFIKNLSRSMSYLFLLGSSVVGSLILLLITKIQANSLPAGGLWLMVVILFVAGFITSAILSLTTYVFKIDGRSFAKSLTFTSLMFVITFIFSLLSIIKIPGFIVFVLDFIVSVLLFSGLYGTKFFKSLGILIVNLIFSIIIGVVMNIIIFFAGFGSAMYYFSMLNNHPVSDIQGTSLR